MIIGNMEMGAQPKNFVPLSSTYIGWLCKTLEGKDLTQRNSHLREGLDGGGKNQQLEKAPEDSQPNGQAAEV